MNLPCSLWAGYVGPDGYGRTKVGGQTKLAHRVAWVMTNGPIPPGLWVLHLESCDKACTEPSHLVVGTPSENARSAWLAGKMNQPRLDAARLAGLSWLIQSGFPVRLATKAYGVHRNYLADRHYKKRKHALDTARISLRD